MAKVTAPLMSLSATGKFGNTLIYQGSRAGISVKKFSFRLKAKTPAQLRHDVLIANLAKIWNAMPYFSRYPWASIAQINKTTAYSEFIKSNARALNHQSTLLEVKFFNGKAGGPRVKSAIASPITGGIRVDFVPAALPQGWQFGSEYSIAIHAGDPYAIAFPATFPDEGPFPGDYTTFHGLITGATYIIGISQNWQPPSNPAPDFGTFSHQLTITGVAG